MVHSWTAGRWATVAVGTVVVALVTGLPTVMIGNPVFTRMIEREWWNRPVWVLTSVLAGLLLATYVRTPVQDPGAGAADRDARRGTIGGLLTYFAIGCPVCNKLVLLALGTTGATSVFAPLQPLLAAASVVLLAWALRTRLRNEAACRVPVTPGRDTATV